MINFNPTVIVAHSQQNSFTTLDQPFPVGHTMSTPGDKPGTGVWESEPWRNEQGLTLEVPIFSKDTNNQYVETTLIDYPVDTSTDYLMADTNVICRWVTVPYQTVGGSQNIDNPNHLDVGVIAFHGSGQIDRVEFFLNGNAQRTIVTEPSHHPDHDVTAYWIRIDNTSGLTDSGDVWGTSIKTDVVVNGVVQTTIGGCTFSKHHELQAVVYPKVGKPRILAGKHNNHKTLVVYNGIFRYWEDSQEKKKILGTKDNGIRSFYFSSNFNDTLFQGSVYVSPDNGVDDLTRSGTEDQPMNSIDFAYRKLMRMKHKFYNNLSTEPTFNYDNPSTASNRIRAEVGGGNIFLMELISDKNKQNGHRSGYKSLARLPLPTGLIVPYQAFSKMRWVTTRPAPGVSKKDAMVKGYHLQPFDTFVGTDDELNNSMIKKINGDIRCTLMQYKNCYVETDWPYSEMMFGIGPDLDVIGDDGRGSKLIELKNWIPKRGIFTKNYDPFSLESGKEYRELNQDYIFTLHNEFKMNDYRYVSETNTAEKGSGPYVPPRFWLDDCHFDGLFRSRQKIYDWANSLGMTHTTTFVGPPDIEGEQRRRKEEDPTLFNLLNDSKIGVFSTLDNRKMPAQLEVTGPNGEGLSLTTPRIYVEPTEQTLVLTNGLGFTLGVGYTFDFCFAHPEFGGCRSALASPNAGGGIPSFVTNTFFQNIDNDPSSLGVDSFINSTLSNYNGDVFRNTSSLIYQPFVYDSLGTRNYVNNSDSRLFGVHSDIFQTVGGEFNFKSYEVGVSNFIFYRFNNPSPRSKRYSDINARHGLTGEGPLDNITFEKQWSISGRHGSINGGDMFTYDNSIYPEGDGRTYTYWNNPLVKDLIYQDCLVYTPDASQELLITCYHENTIYRNTYVHYSPSPNFPNGFSVDKVLDFSPRLLGPVVRYRDAVPNHHKLNSASTDLAEQAGTCVKRLLLDNYQCYQTKQKINPSTGKLFSYGTYQEPLKFNVVKENGSLVNTNINGFFRPKPLGHSLYGPVFGLSNYLTTISDLRYPFERDSSGNAGPNQSVGNNAKIAFPSASDRYNNAFRSYIAEGNALPQPNSSTRGEWFTYHKTIPASTTFGDAPYGWIYSETPYENFKYGRLPHPNGTIQNSKNAAIQAIDPTFLIKKNKDDGAGGLTWGTTIEDTRAALGTGWDPTFGTGKLNPQPTDAGFCANQRGFRESVYFTFTNFDFDATRSEFGEVLTPDRLPILSGESGESGEDPTEQTGQPPSPILNHPITIRLSTTDLTENMSWSRKDAVDNFGGTTHGPDGIYPSSDLIQIPNYLERIEEVTDPNSSPEIGSSVNTEIIGNSTEIGNQGGVYVTGGVADFTLDATIGKMNSLDVKNISTIYLNRAGKNNGLTMSLILHGKSVPGTSMAEFKYIAAPVPELDVNNQEINEGDVDLSGEHYEDFYKKFAYIAFNSRESQVTQSIQSNQFSFRKSPHHTFVQFNRAEIDGLSLSNVLNGTSIMDMVTPINPSKLTKIQTAAIGFTCTFNAASVENTSAVRINPSSSTTLPSIINCKNITMEYLGSEANGNQIRFKNKSATSMFSGREGTINYQHNGAVAAFNPEFNFINSTNDYRISAPPQPLPGEDPIPEPTINLRFLNPVGSGSKNLLGYKVPAGGVRLFGGTNNIGITAGSYIRISGSPNNNGIYQVLSKIDGIDGDTLSNTATNGSTEFQYLELSRSITAQEQAGGNSIMIENVSHLPILHIKYRQQI